MGRGRYICDTLKSVRKKIADANDIKYEPHECTHEGECAGTCPACEAEVRYLERQLDIRCRLGKAVAVVGLSAGIASLSACGHNGVLSGNNHEPLAGIPVMPPKVYVPQPDSTATDSLPPATTTTAQ